MVNFKTWIIILLSTFQFCQCNLVNYYVNLIQSEIERANTFSLPSDSQKDKPFTSSYIEYGTYDHIVVGAGSAGGIVASRLSEDEFRQVLLLEAGGPDTHFTEIPGAAAVLMELEYNWNYNGVPQTTSCLGMPERRCAYPRGKVLGGSSSINGATYTRGCKRDFDNWCAQGNPEWCYKDVLPFFNKLEDSHINGDHFYHGTGGLIHLEYAKPNTRQQRAFIEANTELNRSFIDYNGFRQEGVGITQMNSKNGRRCSTGTTYIKVASKRKNLMILTNSHVTQILINSKTKTAFGVLFAKNNNYYIARSRKDIVVSAGAIGSPQLLMLSGIGPKLHLEQLGIPVIENLSVGENSQDHVGFSMLHFKTKHSENVKSLVDNVKDYLNGIGAFTDPFNAKGLAFIRTNLTKIDDFADIEMLLMSTTREIRKLFGFSDDTIKNAWPTDSLNLYFTIVVALLHPDSRGSIKLKSKDPFDYPLIDSMLLSDSEDRDIETLYEGIQLTLKLLETKAFKDLGVQLHRVHLPACKKHAYLSRDYWYCHIRQISGAFVHLVATCKMGPDPLHGAVVDHKLKVYGIQNLRVADASIIPLIPGAHTNAPVMMIGEKAAHMIRQL